MQSQIHCSDTQDVSFSWIDVPIPVHRERLVMFGVWIIEYLRVTHPQGKSWGRWCVFVCVQLCLFFFQLLCVCVCKREREWNRCRDTQGVSTSRRCVFVCEIFSLTPTFFSPATCCPRPESAWAQSDILTHIKQKTARSPAVRAPKCHTSGAQSRSSKFSKGAKERNVSY